MPDEYKHDYHATFADAKKILKRLRRTAKPFGYSMAIFGSTVLDGQGHDIDMQAMGTDNQKVTPAELAMAFIHLHAKRIFMYEEKLIGKETSDVWLSFLTHDKLYIDLHIKGVELAKDTKGKALRSRGARARSQPAVATRTVDPPQPATG